MIKSFSFLEDDFVGGKATKNTIIVPDLFFIESIDDKFIYYSSLLARVYLVDKEEKEIIEKGKVPKNKHKDFVDGKLLVDKDKFLFPGCNLKEKFSQPEDLFIFLTSNCNLRCQYCFASGGKRRKVIDFDFAKAGIDYVLEKNKEKKINLYFHGGGEPTLAFDLLKKIVSYAKSKADIIKLGLQTNGVAQKHVIDYLSNNKFRLSVSIDGPPSIQDKQRPQKGGGKSSFFTERTIKYLVQQNYPYLRARSTISQFSVDKQVEIVKYLSQLGIKKIHFEPVFEAGRSQEPKNEYQKAPSLDKYASYYLKAKKEADKLGIKLISSFIPLYRRTCAHCGASIPNLFLTPDGYISACYEACDKDTPLQELFYGKFDKKNKTLKFTNPKRIKRLQERSVNNLDACENCFLKWNCAGDCHSKTIVKTGDMFKPDQERCKNKRKATKDYLIYIVKNNLIN